MEWQPWIVSIWSFSCISSCFCSTGEYSDYTSSFYLRRICTNLVPIHRNVGGKEEKGGKLEVISFRHEKRYKWRFWLAFRVSITQMLVKIYNNQCWEGEIRPPFRSPNHSQDKQYANKKFSSSYKLTGHWRHSSFITSFCAVIEMGLKPSLLNLLQTSIDTYSFLYLVPTMIYWIDPCL